MSFKRIIKDIIAKSKPLLNILKDESYFEYFQSKGIHVIPNQFYFPVPDTTEISDEVFEKQSDLMGININEEYQIFLLNQFLKHYKREFSVIAYFKTKKQNEFYYDNGSFQGLDAIALYCMIRYFKPKNIIEIGSGNSTLLSAKAVLKNLETEKLKCNLYAYEPYPNQTLKQGFGGLKQLFARKAQEIRPEEFNILNENDILFIDSTHVLKIDSDVQYLFLEILPRLKKGVIIHVHDIFFPEEYPKEWVLKEKRFWTEQYLLQAFLAFNDTFEVIFAGRFLQIKYPGLIKNITDFYKNDLQKAGSFWFKKAK